MKLYQAYDIYLNDIYIKGFVLSEWDFIFSALQFIFAYYPCT